MAIANPPAFMQAGSYDARKTRMVFDDMFESSGVVGSTDFMVSADPGNVRTIIVTPGSAYLKGTGAFAQGLYHVLSETSVSVQVLANTGSGARTDAVYVVAKDSTVSGSDNTAAVEIAVGTEGSSSIPLIPPTATVIALITVSPGDSILVNSQIFDVREAAALNSYMLEDDYEKIPPGFTPLTPAANWVTYSSAYTSLGARIYAGRVEFKGMLKYTGAAASSGEVTVMNLPSQFRPATRILTTVYLRQTSLRTAAATGSVSHTHVVTSAHKNCRIDVQTSGLVTLAPTTNNTLTAYSLQHISLSGFWFPLAVN